MNKLIQLAKTIVLWLEHRFPEKLTQSDVQAMLNKVNETLLLVQRDHVQLQSEMGNLRADVVKVKMINGLQDILKVG